MNNKLISIILFLVYSNAFPQSVTNIDSVSVNVNDSLSYHYAYPEFNKKPGIWLPAVEVFGFNAGLAAFNNYVSDQSFAKISFESFVNNLKHGFEWDSDVFTVNQFGHPYHGNLYFNTARSNGYSFLESAPFVLGGSLMWELAMETDPPQTNDLINTTFGGIMLGEMTHRISSLLLDESKFGGERFSREVLAFFVNPIRGFNRLLRGDMWRHTSTNVNDFFPFKSMINIGYAGANPKKKFTFDKNNILAEYILIYGDTFLGKSFKPFDFFRLKIGFDAMHGTEPSTWVDSYGLLYGKSVYESGNKKLILGLFQDYDFFYNEVYHLGTQSVGPGAVLYLPMGKSFKLVTTIHSNFVMLGAVNSTFIEGENRDYDFSVGDKTLVDAAVYYGPLSLQLEYRLFLLKSIDGSQGNHVMGFLNPKLLLEIYKGLGLGTEFIFYHRNSSYKKSNTLNGNLSEHRFYLTYIF